jgi:hypothetical protein
MVQRIADGLSQRTARGQLGQLDLEPDAQIRHQRLALGLTHSQPFGGALAADARFDLVERGDPRQRLGRDRRLALGQVIEPSAHMAPAKRQRNGRVGRPSAAELLVGVVAIALQDTAVAAEQGVGMDMPAAGGIAVDHRRRLAAAPRPIVTRDRPEVALLGPPAARIQHRHHGLVGEQPCGLQQHLPQPRHHGRNLGSRIPCPERQRGAVELDALARHDLRLAIQRQMVGIAGHQHMRHQRLGRDPALDQARRCRRLHHRAGAAPAGELRSLGHDDPELRRDHVQPLGGVLANHRHRRPAARARGVLGRQRHLNPRQMCRQRTATGPPLGRIVPAQRRVLLLGLGILFGNRLLKGFQTQLQLFLRQPLGAGAEVHARQLQQQMTQPVILRQ